MGAGNEHDGSASPGSVAFDAIACLNVLDRASRPLSLLRRMRCLLGHDGALLERAAGRTGLAGGRHDRAAPTEPRAAAGSVAPHPWHSCALLKAGARRGWQYAAGAGLRPRAV